MLRVLKVIGCESFSREGGFLTDVCGNNIDVIRNDFVVDGMGLQFASELLFGYLETLVMSCVGVYWTWIYLLGV